MFVNTIAFFLIVYFLLVCTSTIPIETFHAPVNSVTSAAFEPLPFFGLGRDVLGRKLIRHHPMRGYSFVGD